MKTCTICLELKDLSCFNITTQVKSGYTARCKKCTSEYNQKRYLSKSSEIIKYQRDYYNKNKAYVNNRQKKYVEEHKERTKDNQSKYRAKNREKLVARSNKWCRENKDKLIAWRVNNPEKVRAKHSLRRARKRKAEGFFTKDDIKTKIKLQRGLCAVCACSVKKVYQIDHIVPLALGGSNWSKNIQILCPSCNQSKNAKDPIEFMQERGLLL